MAENDKSAAAQLVVTIPKSSDKYLYLEMLPNGPVYSMHATDQVLVFFSASTGIESAADFNH